MTTPTNAEICRFFFEPVPDSGEAPPSPPPSSPSADASGSKKNPRKKRAGLGGANRHRCRVCHNVYTQSASTGYTNLMTHLRIKHPDWPDILQSQPLDDTGVRKAVEPVAAAAAAAARIRGPSTGAPKFTTPGRKRGPVYAHFDDAPASPGHLGQKRMRCHYCHVDTPQLSGKLKRHLLTQCPNAPEPVKLALSEPLDQNQNHNTVVTKTETRKKALALPPRQAAALRAGGAATVKPSKMEVREQQKTLLSFEEQLTIALVANGSPWSLLDSEPFRKAMLTLRPAGFPALGAPGSAPFPVTATHARTEVVDRLAQQYDRDCHNALSTSRCVTLVVRDDDSASPSLKTTTRTYLALDETRRAFVLAERDDDASSDDAPHVTELLDVFAGVPVTNAKWCLCASTTGGYTTARRQLLREDKEAGTASSTWPGGEDATSTTSAAKPFTLMGACMTQQSSLLLRELVSGCQALKVALGNGLVLADAMRVIPSLRRRVLRHVRSGDDATDARDDQNEDDKSVSLSASSASWRSVAMAVKQATRLEPSLRMALAQEKQTAATSTSSSLLRQLVHMGGDDVAWSALRQVDELLTPLHFVAALSELSTTTAGQVLALWIWLFGVASRSSLLDTDTFMACFLRRLQCYGEDHFVACLVLDPRVHGAGLSATGLRRARGVAVRVAAKLLPELDETSFVRSYNDYMKQQGDFGEPGSWNAANTTSPRQFWDDYEGDPLHSQLATVAKTLCAFVPVTQSMESHWAAHASGYLSGDAAASTTDSTTKRQHEKLSKIRNGVSTDPRAKAKAVGSMFETLLDVDNALSVDAMLRLGPAEGDAGDAASRRGSSSRGLSVHAVLQTFQDGLEEDSAALDAPSTTLDASWFDVSPAGLDAIRNAMKSYLNVAGK
ncbi:hypothetical protein BBJ28_00014022 [Nothophytophthora sp. Chile5]|nr:hypothetical protein BBJ28_00014022 [Nothophytophthora sp. Chile5]